MFCSNCGNKLKNEYKFCPSCGEKIELNSVDSLYEEVKDFVIRNNKVSIKLIENEFKVTTSKASKLIKELENNGVVSPSNGRKGREVLIKNIKEKEENEKDKTEEKFFDKVKKLFYKVIDTKDYTNEFDKNDINDNMFLAMLSYVGIFAFIPYFIHTDSKYVKFHATLGINLLIIEVIYTLLDQVLSLIKVSKVVVDYGSLVGTKMVTPLWISIPMSVIGVCLSIISLIGIINVCNKKAKLLPVIGEIKIIK